MYRKLSAPPFPEPGSGARLPWVDLADEELLSWRLCDLGVRIRGSPLERPIAQLGRELRERRMRFRPHFWLSDEWFTPDGVPGVAIPFYLTHPRLASLERSQMLEVEGGTYDWCMRILRHETGHALDNAYQLRRRRRRQEIFGRASLPYPESYLPRPYSRSYVVHLDSWYAQSHPTEDFAETFAVWLAPGSTWRERYARWPAFKKLEYVDQLMREIADRQPPVTTRARVEPLSSLRKTLGEHYRAKRERYEVDFSRFYDRHLKQLFAHRSEAAAANPSAASFLTGLQKEVRKTVADWTGVYQYLVNEILKDMIRRCRELDLRLKHDPERTKRDFTIVLTIHTMNYLHSGRYRLAL